MNVFRWLFKRRIAILRNREFKYYDTIMRTVKKLIDAGALTIDIEKPHVFIGEKMIFFLFDEENNLKTERFKYIMGLCRFYINVIRTVRNNTPGYTSNKLDRITLEHAMDFYIEGESQKILFIGKCVNDNVYIEPYVSTEG